MGIFESEFKDMLLKNNLSITELKLLYIDIIEITHEAKEPRYPSKNGLLIDMYNINKLK